MNAPISELPDWARGLLAGARVARLGYLGGDGRPRVLPITFATHRGCLWFAIDRKPKRDPNREPARVRALRRHPAVAVTVDRYSDEWRRLAWVQLLGGATVLDAAAASGALAALAARYEPYRREPPPGPVVRIEVERALSWRAE